MWFMARICLRWDRLWLLAPRQDELCQMKRYNGIGDEWTHVHTYTHTHTHTITCITNMCAPQTCILTSTCTHTHSHERARSQTHIRAHTLTCVHVLTHIHMHTQLHMHKHTCTQTCACVHSTHAHTKELHQFLPDMPKGEKERKTNQIGHEPASLSTAGAANLWQVKVSDWPT